MPSRKRRRRLEREGVQADGEKLYKLSQLADAANVSLRTVQKHAAEGKLKVRRIGPHALPRVTESEKKRYLDDDNAD